MSEWNRRAVLATGATLTTTGLLATTGAVADDNDNENNEDNGDDKNDDYWVDDFNDAVVGSVPDGWSSPTDSDFEIVTSPGRIGGTEVELQSSDAASHILVWDDAEEFEDGEVAAVYDATTRTGNGHRLFLRTQNGGSDAYFLEPRPDNNELMIRRYSGGGLLTLETTSKSLSATDGHLHARFRVEGDELMGKAWNSGDDEPDDWDIETTSTDVEGAGAPAIGTYNGPDESWSAVAIAEVDATAPVPQAPPEDRRGGTVDRAEDTRVVLNQTGPSGVRIEVEEDILGLELTISENTTGVDTAEIADELGNTLETKSISDLGPSDTFEMAYDLEAGNEYIVLVFADDSYDRGDYDDPEWSYDGDEFQVVEGIWGRDNSSVNHFYSYTELTALVEPDEDDNGDGDDENTEYEECHLIEIHYEWLPEDVREEVDTALEEGSYESDELLFAEAIDTEESFLVIDDVPYEPVVEASNGKQTLEFTKVDTIRNPKPIEIHVRNADNREHKVHVEFTNDETYVDENIALSPDEETSIEATDRFGSYDLSAQMLTGHESEDSFEFQISDSHGHGYIEVSDDDVLVSQEVAEIVPCPWDETQFGARD